MWNCDEQSGNGDVLPKYVEFIVETVLPGQISLQVFQLSFAIYHYINSPYSSLINHDMCIGLTDHQNIASRSSAGTQHLACLRICKLGWQWTEYIVSAV
jgi:hypothetical protein